ncbi:MAG: hypothetical protein O9353_05235, partial [Bacteroidia bacterium]|nr:hypothetical protein [Bacteroidia bacterium]
MKKNYIFWLLFYVWSAGVFAQVGTLTGTGMSICNLYSFSVCPNQTITPLNYGNQGYACTGTSMPDVSFNINGPAWRVMKNNWFFSASTGGLLQGYSSSGILQTIPFSATNTITPLNYSGSYVQFALNGVAAGTLINQATFSISLNPVGFGSTAYTYCPTTNTSIAISPVVPTTGGPWSYSWQPGSLVGNPINVSPSANTVYTVTATGGGCPSTATVAVNIYCNTNSGASFLAPDTLCTNQSFSIANTSTLATSHYWSFCQGNTNVTPSGSNLGNIGFFNGPVFSTIAKDASGYYVFVTNNSSSMLSRLYYGNSLLNTPVATSLGNVSGALPNSLEDLHIEYESGNWYGIAVGGFGGAEQIVRLSFGNSLSNIPAAVSMGNIGGMNYPQRLKIFKSGGNYYGFTTNRNNNTITRFNFGNSITNTPTGVNLGNIGALNTPDAIALVNVASAWYGYVINEGNNTITRLDFGTSLLSTPVGINLGNTGALNGPRGLDMWTECNEVRGLITNRFSDDILNMSLPAGPTGLVTTTSFGNMAGFSSPHSITRFRSGDTLFALITNVSNNTISRIHYPSCTNASVPSTTLTTPPPVSYNAPGTYYVNLVINEGLITQSSYCKAITVVAPPVISVAGASTCAGSVVSMTATGATLYTWANASSLSGSTGSVVAASPSVTTTYTITGSNGHCTNATVATVSV